MSDAKKPAGKTPLDVAQLQAQIIALTKDLEEARKALQSSDGLELQKYKELAARAQADLQNAKARVERERDDIGKFASEGLMRRLLPTIDNLQRAIQHLPADLKDHEWAKGVVATEQEFLKQLSAAGLKKMEALGTLVDADRHEVLMTGPGPQGTVVEVFEDGYELGGRVLRPAKVRSGDGSAA